MYYTNFRDDDLRGTLVNRGFESDNLLLDFGANGGRPDEVKERVNFSSNSSIAALRASRGRSWIGDGTMSGISTIFRGGLVFTLRDTATYPVPNSFICSSNASSSALD